MKRIGWIVLASVGLSGCGSLSNPLDSLNGGEEGVGPVEVVEVESYEAASAGSADQRVMVEGEALEYQGEDSAAAMAPSGLTPPAQLLFFFDFDRSAVSAEDLTVLQAHAAYLINNPVMMVRLEGHADERGSREYNLALGERRAQTVSDLLIAEGVSSGQIEIISYGEETPLEEGHEEAFWSQNRRVELSYPQ